MNPINYAEIEAYARLQRMAITVPEVQMLRLLDRKKLELVDEEAKRG